MKFTKLQGCGNDYVYVNGFTEKLSPEEKPEIVRSLSDRHFGIGGDGVIFINPAEEADFEVLENLAVVLAEHRAILLAAVSMARTVMAMVIMNIILRMAKIWMIS